MSTMHPHCTTFATAILFDHETHDYAMHLDGEIIGFARTEAEAQTTLQKLIDELLSGASAISDADTRPPTDTHVSADALPLPPFATIAETLGVLAAHDDDVAIYALAARRLAQGVSITADGKDRLIDGVRVRRAPADACWPWPWRCECGEGRCWHGALVEGILVAWERLGRES
jgi:hypothetical protein